MSDEMKKAWISIIVPIVHILMIFYFPYPESLDNIIGYISTLIPLLFAQFYLTRFLNKKFPTWKDSRDELKNNM